MADKQETIYVVTSGEYSDYRVNGLFTIRDKAQAYIDYHTTRGLGHVNDMQIEEWGLDDFFDPISRGLTCYRVRFADLTQGDATAEASYPVEDGQNVTSRIGRPDSQEYYQTWVWAKNENGALKIANERRVKFIHQREGAQK